MFWVLIFLRKSFGLLGKTMATGPWPLATVPWQTHQEGHGAVVFGHGTVADPREGHGGVALATVPWQILVTTGVASATATGVTTCGHGPVALDTVRDHLWPRVRGKAPRSFGLTSLVMATVWSLCGHGAVVTSVASSRSSFSDKNQFLKP